MSLFYPLEKIIGEDYVKMIQKDEKSMNYATYQFKKFRAEIGDVDALEPKACQILRTQAKEDLGCRERPICKWYGR